MMGGGSSHFFSSIQSVYGSFSLEKVEQDLNAIPENLISDTDREKIDSWSFRPSDEIYCKHKEVFDNPVFYDQSTGKIHWPKNDGFIAGSITEVIVDETTVFKRYGEPSGEFLGNPIDSFESRALPPHSIGVNEYYYQPTETFEITSGNVAPWFGSAGGGVQYVKYKSDGTRYSIQELLNLGLIKDITNEVKEGVIKID